METKTVGILGTTGVVGGAALQTILASTGHRLLLGGRNPEKLREQLAGSEDRGDWLQVDVFDAGQLADFCGRCDIVINCAGPAKQVMDKVAVACLEKGVPYVDVSGDEHLYRHLLRRKAEIEAKGLTFIISAGVYPGLSEVFPAYVAEKELDSIEQLELFFAGQGGFSLNAAYDIVCSIEEDTGWGMSYCREGAVQKIDGPFHRSYTLPQPAGKRDTYPVLTEEFCQMARQHSIPVAYFYNSYQHSGILNQFVMIKALQQYKTEEQKRLSANMLLKQFETKQPGVEDFTMFHLNATGLRAGASVRLSSTLLYRGDWNRLSGMIAAKVAHLLTEGHGSKPGCYFAAEGVSATALIEALREQTMELTQEVSEQKGGGGR
ncbi:saccharopine dehydrogenase family protein [Brevibacillus agri]|uniref:saccharopine dehydrogenase family protein n=1 Tax=Brevibacillus agri TaxID=51101 RepID=UPI0030F427AD